ncbi:MAG: SOS response-associated peptidase [Hyphomicrobiaceae bacterium]
MCNLYSATMARQAMLRLFRVSDNRAASIEPKPAIFPGGTAPVVRMANDGERELVALSWGFVLLQKGLAPKRVTNVRDDKLGNPFWRGSFEERRCLVPVSSFAEPKGRNPATWHWFALNEAREPFAFAGIWRRYNGPLKKDGEPVELDVHAFLTTTPNELVATVHPQRMPVMLVGEEAQEQWMAGTTEDARGLIRAYPAAGMRIVQSGTDKQNLQVTEARS